MQIRSSNSIGTYINPPPLVYVTCKGILELNLAREIPWGGGTMTIRKIRGGLLPVAMQDFTKWFT